MPPSLPIAGVLPFSATDWPGNLTVTAFTQGCPFSCPYCHNPQLQQMAPGQPFAQVLELLATRRGLIDALVISGGEPTMHAGLGDAIAATHDLGFPVGLHTCGYRPSAIRSLLSDPHTTPDWVGLDIKALPQSCVSVLGMTAQASTGCWDSLDLLTAAEVPVQVRTTVWPGSVLAEQLPTLRAQVERRGHELVVQQARNVNAAGRYQGP